MPVPFGVATPKTAALQIVDEAQCEHLRIYVDDLSDQNATLNRAQRLRVVCVEDLTARLGMARTLPLVCWRTMPRIGLHGGNRLRNLLRIRYFRFSLRHQAWPTD